MKPSVLATSNMSRSIRAAIDSGPVATDDERGLRVYGPLEGVLSHLVVVLLDDASTEIRESEVMFPLPEEFGRGFLGLARDYLSGVTGDDRPDDSDRSP